VHLVAIAHRTNADLENAGIRLELDTRATHIDVDGHVLRVTGPGGRLATAS
jgi:hypothetical protein